MELERIYGIQNGVRNDRKNLPNNSEGKTQEDLASELGMSVDTIANLKRRKTVCHPNKLLAYFLSAIIDKLFLS